MSASPLRGHQWTSRRSCEDIRSVPIERTLFITAHYAMSHLSDAAVRSKRTENNPRRPASRLVLPTSQLRLQNLAVVILWKRLDENILLGPLEPRNMVETNLVEFRFIDLRAIAGHYVSDHFLSPVFVLS